ncbi:MAG: bifunctional ADP-heptose synthase [Candidatus Aminicenantes bacterium]|nr:bifunctional ADP-heptose synthase [Candidatus Aminicenantes bacterium]
MNKKSEKISEIIESFSGKNIIVWGDIILDEYIYGTTRRVSREAPVLVLSYKKKEYALGGAGNALLNLQSLGANPVPVGVIGKDAAGEKIIQILKAYSISTKHLIQSNNFPTPTKSRILAGEETAKKQQILRIDYEGKAPVDSSVQEKLLKSLTNLKDNSQALLISDYNYFVVRESIYKQILPGFRKSKIPVSLDSRFRVLNFKGVNVSTPNESEVEDACKIEFNSDEDLINKTGRRLLNETEAQAILITRGSKGMVLFERGKPPWAIPIHGTTDIVDVTGAGDTVICVFTLALACGSSNKDAATLANHAGGIVVMKKGTAVLTIEELKKSIQSEN